MMSMSVYTVQAPPDLLGAPELSRAVVLREGFSWPAFFFGTFWLIWKGLWLTAAIWIAIYAGLAWLVGSRFSLFAAILVAFLLQLLLGLEANTLLRQKFTRQRYRLVDVVVADAPEVAERLSFPRIAETQGDIGSMRETIPQPPVPQRDGEVLGFFPQPEELR
jgi:hypothetical protein